MITEPTVTGIYRIVPNRPSCRSVTIYSNVTLARMSSAFMRNGEVCFSADWMIPDFVQQEAKRIVEENNQPNS